MTKSKSKNKLASAGYGRWVVTCLLLCIGASTAWLISNPAKVIVPAVVGMSESDASALIKASGLEVVIRTEKPTDGVKPGEVIRQVPSPRTSVPKMSVITLTVGAELEQATIPDVTGQTRSQAEDSLLRLGLKVNFVEVTSDSIAIGSVIEQTPKAGEKAFAGSTVTLTISGGESHGLNAPNLIGMTVEESRAELERLNLGLEVVEAVKDDYRTGDPKLVFRQDPEPGQAVLAGSKVSIFLPISPPTDSHDADSGNKGKNAPRLEGLSVGAAKKLAAEQGIALELADSADDGDTITFQEPPPGDPLSSSDPAVTIRVSQSAVVPNINGLQEAEARAKIKKAGLAVGKIRVVYGQRAGDVVDQRPSAGIEVVSGSSVDITITDPSGRPYSSSTSATTKDSSGSAAWVE